MTAEPRETREPGAAMSPTSVCTDRGPSAVMWDMDGTLTDTEPLWLAAELELAARYDARWSQSDALAMVGRPTLETAALLHERGVTMAPEEIVAAMAGAVARAFAREPAWHAGSIELLRQGHAPGLPPGLVASSPPAGG
ncbi:MAG TPA: haloacid dehalogenase, partial [Micrococcales bacterium]|nr:haloacid dehalogenase [Micrococcales bacterium]